MLKIKNIGMIGEAEIEINGLTVIAGENDTGKSTVGKLMFSLVKAFGRYAEDFDEDKRKKVRKAIEMIYFKVRYVVDFDEREDLRNAFYPLNFYNEIDFLVDTVNPEKTRTIIQHKISLLNDIEMTEYHRAEILGLFTELESLMIRDTEKDELIQKALYKAFISEFNFEITNKFNNKAASINYFEGKSKIFDIQIGGNKISNLKVYNEPSFNDATYIESPVILQMYDLISSKIAVFEIDEYKSGASNISKIPFHMRDLMAKLENAKDYGSYLNYLKADKPFSRFNSKELMFKEASSDYYGISNTLNENPTDTISHLINGDLSFESEIRDFQFTKSIGTEDIKIKSANIATGIKSFGIIQLLLQGVIEAERNLLIIDEPEIHLHPKWQVEYARLIVELVKRGIHILITSHSPYIIQALKYYSEKEQLQHKTKFYLAEATEDRKCSNIEDATNNLNKIFKKLSDPMQELVWG